MMLLQLRPKLLCVLLWFLGTVHSAKPDYTPSKPETTACPSHLRVRSLSQADVYPVTYIVNHLAKVLSKSGTPLTVWYDFNHELTGIDDPCIFDIVVVPAKVSYLNQNHWRRHAKQLLGVARKERRTARQRMATTLRNWNDSRHADSWHNEVRWPQRHTAADDPNTDSSPVPLRYKKEGNREWVRRPFIIYVHNLAVEYDTMYFGATEVDLVLSPTRTITGKLSQVPVGHFIQGAAKGFQRTNELQRVSYPNVAYNPSNLVSSNLPSRQLLCLDTGNSQQQAIRRNTSLSVVRIMSPPRNTIQSRALHELESMTCDGFNKVIGGACDNKVGHSSVFGSSNSASSNVNGPGDCRGTWLDSMSCIAPYRFALVFEQEISLGMVSERLFAAKLAQTVPVYLGAPDVDQFVNPDSFIWCKVHEWETLTDGWNTRETGSNSRMERVVKECVQKVLKVHEQPNEYQRIQRTPLYFHDKWDDTKVDGTRLAKGISSLIQFLL